MDFGVHLPLADLGQGLLGGRDLRLYTATAAELGFDMVSANDHLVWRRPWLDGLTSLASVVGSAGGMTLATSVALPAVRHPVVLAKAIASLGVLSEGPVIAGLGPGSSAADYEAVGLPFTQRWARFDEALRVVRALVRGEAPYDGQYYRVGELRLDPLPSTPPQVWFGSWGSDLRLRRMAGAADGWLASAYNTTPEHFADARSRLDEQLLAEGRDRLPILTRSPQPGCMSPTSTLKPSAWCPRHWHRFWDATPASSSLNSRSELPSTAWNSLTRMPRRGKPDPAVADPRPHSPARGVQRGCPTSSPPDLSLTQCTLDGRLRSAIRAALTRRTVDRWRSCGGQGKRFVSVPSPRHSNAASGVSRWA